MLTEQDEYFALFPGKTLGETDSGAKSEQESISAGKQRLRKKKQPRSVSQQPSLLRTAVIFMKVV